ncbi:MAG: hypothetical protein ACYTFW_05190 [Planctomycetota bacterium]|jgi:hypothetical protein
MNVSSPIYGLSKLTRSFGILGWTVQDVPEEPQPETLDWLKKICVARRFEGRILAGIYQGTWIEILNQLEDGYYHVRQLDAMRPIFLSPWPPSEQTHYTADLSPEALQDGLSCCFLFLVDSSACVVLAGGCHA